MRLQELIKKTSSKHSTWTITRGTRGMDDTSPALVPVEGNHRHNKHHKIKLVMTKALLNSNKDSPGQSSWLEREASLHQSRGVP